MVTGLNSFIRWFADYGDQYAIIGGTACDICMSELGYDFRATKDIDMVLLVESLTPAFGLHFWEYVKAAGYAHRNKSTEEPQFYRFTDPSSSEYPFMIELFSTRIDAIHLPETAVLTPLPLADGISSLSAILMDEAYYGFLREGIVQKGGVTIPDAAHLIPFKAKAWLDLRKRKALGEHIDSKNIRKHRNDVFRLSVLLSPSAKLALPEKIYGDMASFFLAVEAEQVDTKVLGLGNTAMEDVVQRIKLVYSLKE